jgi:L-fuculose-phosphate aldolase
MTHPAEWHEAIESLIHYGRRLNTDGLAVGPAGNISVRLGDRILITPSQIPYDRITPESICVLDQDGAQVGGTGTPSAETPLHVGIYARSTARAIVHTHSPCAVAVSATLTELPAIHYAILRLGGSTVRVAPYARFGSDELAGSVLDAMGDGNAAIMQNHGTVTCADDLDTAYERAQLLEWLSGVYRDARLLGEPRILDEDELAQVSAESRRRRYGAEAARN